MLFLKGAELILNYVGAEGPSPDYTVTENLVFTSSGSPRGAYAGLKGSAPNMDWPQGATPVPFNAAVPGFGNNLLTDFSGDYGVRNWQIYAPPDSYIPGKLQLAYYLHTNPDNASPDVTVDFTFGSGVWTTGDLFVFTGTFADDYYREPWVRFTPGPLIIPLGV